MLGMHGSKAANMAVQECDLLVCIGARFDDRATGMLAEFAPRARVIHMDVDPAEIAKLRRPDVALVGDLRAGLRELTRGLARPLSIRDWQQECDAKKREHGFRYDDVPGFVNAPRFIRGLSEAAGEDTVVACDVGQHQMWVAQHYQFRHPHQHLTSGGLGAMGYGLPAAIGAQISRPSARVIAVSGDGSFMMNIHELATVKRYHLPLKIVLFDNKSLGMVRQWQELFFGERYSEVDLSDNPDFVRLARAFGVPAFRVERDIEVPAALERLIREPGPLLAHVLVDREANVWPLVPPGKSNSMMLEG
jgi:acetolactate synthase-1/2/3 large subunit